MVRGRGAVFGDGEGRPGPHQVVAGIMGETAGLAQRTGGTHTVREEGGERVREQESEREREIKNQQIHGGDESGSPEALITRE